MISVGIVGATGYSGSVCARLVAGHDALRLAFATAGGAAGSSVGARLGGALEDTCKLHFSKHDEAVALARDVDVVLLATSTETSQRLVPTLVAETKALVVDLSGAFRQDETHYGLPELFGAPKRGTRIIANPGCYATAALLAVAPLARAGLIASDRVFVDGKSGVTGAGRRAEEDYSFVEIAEDVRAYRIGTHQHTPEIARQLQRAANRAWRVTFTPHLLPLRRGLIVTAYAEAKGGATDADVSAALTAAYGGKPFVRVVDAHDATAHAAVGTPHALVGARVTDGAIVAVCALDNLLKGAASQALQNINLALGLGEGAGLGALQRFAP